MARKKRPHSRLSLGPRSHTPLAQAQRHMARGQWDEALEILLPVTQRQPSNIDALAMLSEVYANTEDIMNLWDVTEKLTRLEPREPTHWVNLSRASLVNNLPFSALHYAEHFLAKWPDHEYADEVRETQRVALMVGEEIRENDSSLEGVSLEDLRLYELSQMAFHRGDVKEGKRIAQKVMQRLPNAVAPLNNLALAYMLQDNLDEAVAMCRQVLERAPGNIHALSNLTQCLVRMGRRDEAQAAASELRAQPIPDGTLYAKVFEAYATLGDDEAIIELYTQYEQSKWFKELRMAIIHHLAAVSYARQGDTRRAKTLWRRALKHEPHFSLAHDNMADLKLPAGERSGAWPFALDHWVSRETIEMLARAANRSRRSDAALERAFRRALSDNPYIETILPTLLERGDLPGREFALMLAHIADLPLLRDFALGQDGTDEQRMSAGQHAVELGLLPRGKPVPLTLKGEPTELLLLAYEIHEEPEPSTISDEAQDLLELAHDALQERLPKDAEALAREALELAPDAPTLMNYLALSLTMQDREEEAREVIERTVERHPDYLFGRTAMAQVCIREERLEDARTWLDPLLARPRFHVSEFRALCLAQIELLIAEKQYDGAESWLSFLDEMEPDLPALAILRMRLLFARGLPRKRKKGKTSPDEKS